MIILYPVSHPKPLIGKHRSLMAKILDLSGKAPIVNKYDLGIDLKDLEEIERVGQILCNKEEILIRLNAKVPLAAERDKHKRIGCDFKFTKMLLEKFPQLKEK